MTKTRVSLRLRERLIFVPLVERSLWEKYFDEVKEVEDKLDRTEDRLKRGAAKLAEIFRYCDFDYTTFVLLEELTAEMLIES